MLHKFNDKHLSFDAYFLYFIKIVVNERHVHLIRFVDV